MIRAGIAIMRRLLVCVSLLLLGACGDDGGDGESVACNESDGPATLISDYTVKLRADHVDASYRLARGADVGILLQRTGGTAKLGPQIRVPLGTKVALTPQSDSRDLSTVGVERLDKGTYTATLRAFDVGKLNQGDPLDTSTRCVTVN